MSETQRKMVLPSEANATGRTFDNEEIELLIKTIRSGTLNCTRGTMVLQLEKEFARVYGVKNCIAVTSGTAALHCAIAATNLEPGDEVITTPITDMGAITPILYQTGVPVFADVDPYTYNITADTIEKKITRRTKAIIVTHLFGNPCDMQPILDLANKHGILVIEDAAQAFFATYRGQRVGTLGSIGCFSLQQTKHMTAGEGGLVITNNPQLARHIRLFHDKAWGYGDPKPDHYFLALNYRMTELQGAVALAQLKKVQTVVERRQIMAQKFTDLISTLKGIQTPKITKGATHVYWKYVLRVDEKATGIDVGELATRLRTRYDIFSAPRYIAKPAFQCEVLREAKTFGNSGFPLRNNPFRKDDPPIHYRVEDYPGTMDALAHMLVLPWNELYTDRHIEYIAEAIKDCLYN
ncbi:MAG TPA: DegT/DnrJ/EryC1/StrS family aminotransferase [Candidatus Limnocylindrales bacterium]|nr:DegT/DnrJ/EryC1/StrS family aminotransferase [Candidatus Limnocylindrales bacterium]